MKLLAFTILLCPLLFATPEAQETQPKLMESFDRIPCPGIRSRLDIFLLDLSRDPAVYGFVVLSKDTDFTKAVARRGLVENHFKVRRFDLQRINFVRKSGLPEFGVELWKAPGSTALPFTVDSEWSYKVPKATKPFIVYSGGWNASECYFPSGVGILKEFLTANPGSRGNIVIRCNGKHCLNEQKKLILDEMKENDIPQSRIRFFYVPIRSQYFATEFWLLPD